MSLPERQALRNTIRRRLNLLETIQLSLKRGGLSPKPVSDSNQDWKWESRLSDCCGKNPADQGGCESPGGPPGQTDKSPDPPNKPLQTEGTPNNDSNTIENTTNSDQTQFASLAPPPGGGRSIHPVNHPADPQVQPGPAPPLATSAEITKLETYHRTLKGILGGIDRHIADGHEKHRLQTAARWAAVEPRSTFGRRRCRRWNGSVDYGADPFATVGVPSWGEQEPEPKGRATRSTRLVEVCTPDDLLWEEARKEAGEMFGLGYAYRRDRVGRRVHRL